MRAEIESLHGAIALLHRIANLVRASLELEPTFYAVLTSVTAGVGLGMNRAMLFLVDDDAREVLRGRAAVGPADPDEADRVWKEIEATDHDLEALYAEGLRHLDKPGRLDGAVRALRVSARGDSPLALALRRGAPIVGEGTDDLGGLLDLKTCIAAPLRGRHVVRGVLYADNCFTGRRLAPIHQLVFGMVADHAGRAIESAEEYERLACEARTDALTGLRHHGALMTDLEDEIAEARAKGRALGLVMIDLDGFKPVNDELGHLAGDGLLAGVATRLRGAVREGDRVYRYGGDEFAVILPGLATAQATAAAERLRAALAGRTFTLAGAHEVTVKCSVGVADLGDATNAASLVALADAALLRAKSEGKDRVAR
jgi:diguanylate cyclase (GGDEF)-like protein